MYWGVILYILAQHTHVSISSLFYFMKNQNSSLAVYKVATSMSWDLKDDSSVFATHTQTILEISAVIQKWLLNSIQVISGKKGVETPW